MEGESRVGGGFSSYRDWLGLRSHVLTLGGRLVSWVSGPLTSSQVFSFSLHSSSKWCLYSDGKILELVHSLGRHDESWGIKDFVLVGKFVA